MSDVVLARTLERVLATDYVRPRRAPEDASVLDLAVGEARYPLPSEIRAEFGDAVTGLDRMWYGDPAGAVALRAAFLRQLLAVPAGVQAAGPGSGTPVRVDDLVDRVLVTSGGKEAAMLAVRYQFHRRGHGSVLLPRPGWEPYGIWAHAHSVQTVPYDPAALAVDPRMLYDLVARAADRPSVLVLNYPHNPTGATLDQGGMDELIAAAVDLDLAVVSDEVYRWFAVAPVSAVHAPAYDPALHLVVDSTSKRLTTAGLRVGFLVGEAGIVRSLTAFRATYASCTSVVDQCIAEVLLSSPAAAAWLVNVRASVDIVRRETVYHLIGSGVPVLSDGALYIWCAPLPLSHALGASGPMRALVATGTTFGAAGHVRLCTARADLDPIAAAAAVCTTLRDSHA